VTGRRAGATPDVFAGQRVSFWRNFRPRPIASVSKFINNRNNLLKRQQRQRQQQEQQQQQAIVF
jgi:hypothetical protein